MVVTHPQVLEYRVERTMQCKINLLMEYGVRPQDIPKLITRAPNLFALAVEKSLKPRINYLLEEVGVDRAVIGEVITRHPLLLTNSVTETMTPRVEFLRELGVSREGVAKMVTRHPQILHYKIESMLPRLRYLQSIGMKEEDIILCVSRLSQIFSLSVDNSLRPKFEYLKSHLGGTVTTVTKYPAYFSLSLEKRIKPRHLILLERGRCKLPFPMKWFSMKDEEFADKVAGVTVEEFYAFRDRLLLKEFERKNSLSKEFER